jgi:hypothetical protein
LWPGTAGWLTIPSAENDPIAASHTFRELITGLKWLVNLPKGELAWD